jgi:hypothetical protein
MLARIPWTSSEAAPLPKVVRITRDRRRHIVRTVAAILATAEPTPFALEASCRHAIRSRLCLRGWTWAKSDDMAADIVRDALKRVGAQRPTWLQGQPEWANEGFAPILRTRCIRCSARLPEGHWKFCSQLCGQAHFHNQSRIQAATEGEAYDLVVDRFGKWGQDAAAR